MHEQRASTPSSTPRALKPSRAGRASAQATRVLRRTLPLRRPPPSPQVLTGYSRGTHGYSWVLRGLRCALLIRVGYTREDACVPMNLRRAASQCLNVELTRSTFEHPLGTLRVPLEYPVGFYRRRSSGAARSSSRCRSALGRVPCWARVASVRYQRICV